MFKFLHAADIHLDSPLRGLETYEDAPVDEIRRATRRAFDNLIDFAIQESIDFLLIAGDLYDGDWKDYNTGLFFVDRMSRLKEANIPVYLISGNHDAASQITKALPLPENVTLFRTKKPETFKLEEIGVAIHAQSYPNRSVEENLAVQYPTKAPDYFNIGILHTSLTGREGHEPYAPCSLDDLKSKGYHYWALGHIHNREVVSKNPWVVFPGNIQGRHIRETGSKGATLVTVEEDHRISVEHLEFDVLRWAVCEVDLSKCETESDVHEQVRKDLEKEQDNSDDRTLAVRLKLTGNSSLHTRLIDHSDQWIEEFRGLAAGIKSVWLEKVLFRTYLKKKRDLIIGSDIPLNELMKSVETIDLQYVKLLGLVPEIETLKKKLPPEISGEAESFLPNDPGALDQLREEVKELLETKLIRHGDR